MVSTRYPSGLRDGMDPEAPSCLVTGKSSTVLSGREFTSEVRCTHRGLIITGFAPRYSDHHRKGEKQSATS